MAQLAADSKRLLSTLTLSGRNRLSHLHFRGTSGHNNKVIIVGERKDPTRQFDHRPPSAVTYPPEPTYEEPVKNNTQATERDQKVRNQQLKVNWQNRCKKIDEIGVLCGDKPWELCKQKAVSLLDLCLKTEGLRIFKSNYPHFRIEKQPFKDLWQAMDDSFNKIFRESSVEAVKIIIYVFKHFNNIDFALLWKPIMWYRNCQ